MYNAYLSIKATMQQGYSYTFVSSFASGLCTRGWHKQGDMSVFYFEEGCIVMIDSNIQVFYGSSS